MSHRPFRPTSTHRLTHRLGLATAAAAATAIGVVAVPSLGASAAPTPAPSSDASVVAGSPADVARTIASARQASARYHDVDVALADGYRPVSACVASPAGGMGVHFLNPALARDPAIDAAHPEELVYEPRADGSLRLVAVEYFRADADQDLTTDDDRPSLAGQAFDGPMAGHSPGMPIHYDLHLWAWRPNPAGVFSEWNPTVHCPA